MLIVYQEQISGSQVCHKHPFMDTISLISFGILGGNRQILSIHWPTDDALRDTVIRGTS